MKTDRDAYIQTISKFNTITATVIGGMILVLRYDYGNDKAIALQR